MSLEQWKYDSLDLSINNRFKLNFDDSRVQSIRSLG